MEDLVGEGGRVRDDPLMNWPLRGPCQIVPRARARVADRSFAIFKQEGRAGCHARERTYGSVLLWIIIWALL